MRDAECERLVGVSLHACKFRLIKAMFLLVRIPGITYQSRCRLNGFEKGWFFANSVSCSVQNQDPGISVDEESTAGHGPSFQQLKISKEVDGATPQTMVNCTKGHQFDFLEVQVVETASTQAGVHPYFMMRFAGVSLASWSVGLAKGKMSETLVFNYSSIACQFLRTKDGVNYKLAANKGWTIDERSEEWKYDFKLRGLTQ